MQNKSKNQKVLELLLDAEYFKAVIGNITETKIANFVNNFKKILNCLPAGQRTNAVLILLGKTEEFNSTPRQKTVNNRAVICEVTDYNSLTEEVKYKFETVKMAVGHHNLDQEGMDLLKEKTSVLDKESAQKLVSTLTGNTYGHFPTNEKIISEGYSSLSEWLRFDIVEEEEEEVVEEVIEEEEEEEMDMDMNMEELREKEMIEKEALNQKWEKKWNMENKRWKVLNDLQIDYATSIQEVEDAEINSEEDIF